LKNFVEWTGWTLEDALLAVTANPAKALGLANKGVIAPGADADIAILDKSFRVVKTFVGGKLVWTS
jgi:N-acetylglucosamine-6-phosphate deacetylase